MAKKIVIVDENEGFVAVTKPDMNNDLYEVEVTLDSEGSQEKSGKTGLILLDIMMPHPDSYNSGSGSTAGEDNKRSPVILLTGSGSDQNLGKKTEEQTAKPQRFEALLKSLSNLSDIFSNTIRKQLLDSAEKDHIDLRDETLKKHKNNKRLFDLQSDSINLDNFSLPVTLDDGTKLIFRRVQPSDEELLKDMFATVSEDSIAFAQFQPVKAFPHIILEELKKIECFKHAAIGAFYQGDNGEKIIGTSCYKLTKTTGSAEVSFIVRDEWLGKGVSSYLLNIITEIAKTRGVTEFKAVVHKNRKQVLPLFYNSGYTVSIKKESNIYSVTYQIANKLALQRYCNDYNKICYRVGVK